MLKALIFDVDGTLAETEADGHRVAFNTTFEENGIDWVWDHQTYGELLAVFGGKERLKHYWEQHRPDTFTAEQALERITSLHRTKNQHYARIVASGKIPLRPGIAELIKSAQEQGVITAIATTTSRDNVTALLSSNLGPDWEQGFPVIVAGDEVPRKKPAPDVYLEALRRLNLPASACLALEDQPAGLAAARAAQIPCVVTRGIYTPPVAMEAALACVDGLGSVDAPAQGEAPGERFHGVVDLSQLAAWHAASTPG